MNKQKSTCLLSSEEVFKIFNTGYLYEMKSFHYIDPESASYDVNRDKSNFLAESQLIYQKYQQGHTIIVKNMEHYNQSIREKAASLGPFTDVHLYLTPNNGGSSFPYHKDTRDVIVHLVHGSKTFKIREGKDEKIHHLKAGDELFLPMSKEHMASTHGASILLSFGLYSQPIYQVPSLFQQSDFC